MSDQNLVELRGIHKAFGDNVVLAGVDLSVARGEVIVIAGPSGSGKSTMLRCVNGLETADRGEITFDGRPVKPGKGLASLRAEIGFVFQQFHLWPHMSVLDNIALAPVKVKGVARDAARQRAEELLTRVGIAEKAHQFPAELSGGQQQRVAIARALAMDPKLMLFDEPTSALDPEMIREVLDVMRDLAREGMTMLVVTHEMGFAREVCDRLVFIDGGLIVEEGPPAEFFANAQSERAREFVDKIIHH
ncbi:amino acid ABC transporter ATP-binding protein [Solirubrobacter sp. CPCC 204708]|uniref:Amino acid ABC transporter ATP-binding protein n=1 Tax=Solirubrobacter deserti TaxID=2282478 RepID=A0ABT4RS96_9ACTN|nr:amino acid ABC transporter ATP-binding protein [Solirubrobacter deserti]MBE2314372.1 amino acid ABC transporter ATP-binding protein [Solirubrobacter deserti]MDA0141468.1 amino acid ABC transporter ATP-binding protein [Solirubrobacter deserti]